MLGGVFIGGQPHPQSQGAGPISTTFGVFCMRPHSIRNSNQIVHVDQTELLEGIVDGLFFSKILGSWLLESLRLTSLVGTMARALPDVHPPTHCRSTSAVVPPRLTPTELTLLSSFIVYYDCFIHLFHSLLQPCY